VNLPYLIAQRFARSLRGDRFARFTSTVSIASVAIGCVALIVAMSILDGYESAIRSAAMRFAAPIEVRSLLTPLLGERVHDVRSAVARLQGTVHVEPVLTREALGRTRVGVDGIMLIGTTPARAASIVAPMLVDGTIPGSGTTGCTLGVEIARRLGLRPGDTLVIYTAERGSATAPILTTSIVSGIVRSGMQQYDETAVFVDDAMLHTMLRLPPQEASAMAIYPDDPSQIGPMAQALVEDLGPRMFVQTYHQRFAAIESWIQLQKKPIPIVLGLISIVALFTVVATLLIAVVEKTRQVAVLRTLGMPGRSIAAIFLWQGLRVGLLGCGIGSVVAAAFCYVQATWQPITLDGAIYYVSSLPVAFDAAPYLLVAGMTMATSIIASLAPIAIAMRIDPVRILQFR
jgi:lipoprotein-releasing system permease protein